MSKYDLSHYYSLPSSCKLALTYGNTLLLQATSCLSCCVLVRTPHTMFCVQGNVLLLFLVLDRHPHISSLLLCAGSYSSHHRMRTGQRLPLFHVLDRHPHILLFCLRACWVSWSLTVLGLTVLWDNLAFIFYCIFPVLRILWFVAYAPLKARLISLSL